MMLHCALMVLMVVSKVVADTTPIPTCETLKEHAPIIWESWKNDSRSMRQRSIRSYKSGQSVDRLFPKNWITVYSFGPSLLIVSEEETEGSSRWTKTIVDLMIGKTVADTIATNNIINNKLFALAAHHDDQSMVAFDYYKARAVTFNTTTGDIVRHETDPDPDRIPISNKLERPSLSVIEGKYCVIGGNSTKPIPSLCYNKSTRAWTVHKEIKVKRSWHRSIVHNGVLYVCGGDPAPDDSTSCSLFDTKTGNFSRNISLNSTFEVHSIFIMNDAVFIFDWQSKIWQIDPPGSGRAMESSESPGRYNTQITVIGACENDIPMVRPQPEFTEKKLDVHLHASDIRDKSSVKQLVFLRHKETMEFDIHPVKGSKHQIALFLNLHGYMPEIYGSKLDRGFEYVMDQITMETGGDTVLRQMLESSGLVRWDVEIRIQYSCSKCSKKSYAVVVVLVDVWR